MREITAAGGLVFRWKGSQWEVLLIRRSDRWDIPKGHLEQGESILCCAAREVSEELGVSLRCVLPASFLTTTVHSYSLENEVIQKETYWFSMVLLGEPPFHPQQEEGITKAEWFSVERATDLVSFSNLKELLMSFKKCLI